MTSSKWINVIALIVAVIALIVAVVSNPSNTYGDKCWQTNSSGQLEVWQCNATP